MPSIHFQWKSKVDTPVGPFLPHFYVFYLCCRTCIGSEYRNNLVCLTLSSIQSIKLSNKCTISQLWTEDRLYFVFVVWNFTKTIDEGYSRHALCTLHYVSTFLCNTMIVVIVNHPSLDLIWFGCLTPLSAIFQLYHDDQFLWFIGTYIY